MRLRTFYSTILLWLNRIYNVYRARHGQPYYSLSQAIKQKVKSAVSYISDFESLSSFKSIVKNVFPATGIS